MIKIRLVILVLILELETTIPSTVVGTALGSWTEIRKALEDSRRELNLMFQEQEI